MNSDFPSYPQIIVEVSGVFVDCEELRMFCL